MEQISKEILEGYLSLPLTMVAPGQIPRHNGVQLFEKEYVGNSHESVEVALEGALAQLREDHLGEPIYSRGAQVMSVDTDPTQFAPGTKHYMVVVTAALRPLYTDFSPVIALLKRGHRFSRKNWNGKGLSVYIQKFHDAHKLKPCFVLENADGERQPGWVPSISDLLADDWFQTR
uniref:Thoeris anti-defense 2-like domain-containing protein n=1 Tax=Pseudomonas phage HRDY3 TaxID=3236930 RepID=A0AB39CE41_9VIRU